MPGRNASALLPWLRSLGADLAEVSVIKCGEDDLGVSATSIPAAKAAIPQRAWLNAVAALGDPCFGPCLRGVMSRLIDGDMEPSERQIIMLFLALCRNLGAECEVRRSGLCLYCVFLCCLYYVCGCMCVCVCDRIVRVSESN